MRSYRFLFCMLLLAPRLSGQTNCEEGNGLLDFTPPKKLTVAEVILKLGSAESATKDARLHYTYKQDVLMQTLSGKNVTGEFHEVSSISYDEKGRRQEEVTFAAQPSLRGIQLTQTDMEDIRIFMPLLLTSEDLPQYNLTYAGQQHVDDLDTYVFHVEPKKEENGKRYFQGRIWVDAQDFQIVKLCGKSGPEHMRVKKNQRPELSLTSGLPTGEAKQNPCWPRVRERDESLKAQLSASAGTEIQNKLIETEVRV